MANVRSLNSPELAAGNAAPGMPSQLLIGEAPTPEIATAIARRYGGCPYVHYIAAFDRMLVAVTYFPESHRWWLEMVAREPQITLGLARAAFYETDAPAHPATYRPRRVEGDGERSPCGSECPACERYTGCRRCPATAHYDVGSPPESASSG